MKSVLLAAAALALVAAAPAPKIDAVALMRDLKVLSADDMQGRAAGTPGSEKARAYVVERFRQVGLTPTEVPYTVDGRSGVNVWGVVRGTRHPERYIVVTAHYDHLGVKDGQIHNGADDNASGVAALFALAQGFGAQRPDHSILFVALDGEEGGLRGARAFVDAPPAPKDAILLDVNLDMVARGDKGELYASGAYHAPVLRPVLERVAKDAPVRLLLGHDRPEQGHDDWTLQSDHGAFRVAGVPFVYFGVEDHPDYHRPSDDYEKVDAGFYARSVETIGRAIAALDAADAALAQARAEMKPMPRPEKK